MRQSKANQNVGANTNSKTNECFKIEMQHHIAYLLAKFLNSRIYVTKKIVKWLMNYLITNKVIHLK